MHICTAHSLYQSSSIQIEIEEFERTSILEYKLSVITYKYYIRGFWCTNSSFTSEIVAISIIYYYIK